MKSNVQTYLDSNLSSLEHKVNGFLNGEGAHYEIVSIQYQTGSTGHSVLIWYKVR